MLAEYHENLNGVVCAAEACSKWIVKSAIEMLEDIKCDQSVKGGLGPESLGKRPEGDCDGREIAVWEWLQLPCHLGDGSWVSDRPGGGSSRMSRHPHIEAANNTDSVSRQLQLSNMQYSPTQNNALSSHNINRSPVAPSIPPKSTVDPPNKQAP
ncbi:Uncharacterized protein HZ326_13744 [Fusarium oxysporum f. sp. albedinis]|nr:Uncharacterized protein HZ326_13744 [Fusarium oxysporum f. sp. albedinis]